MKRILLFESDSYCDQLSSALNSISNLSATAARSDDAIFPDVEGWDSGISNLEEYDYILSFASEIYEVLSRQYRLEPLKTLSIQDFNLLLKHQYLFLKRTYFNDQPTAVLFMNYPHHGYSVISALICSFNNIPYFSLHQIPCASAFALVPPVDSRRPLTWHFASRIRPQSRSLSLASHSGARFAAQIDTYVDQIEKGGHYAFLPEARVRGKKSSLSTIRSPGTRFSKSKRTLWNLAINRKLDDFNSFLASKEKEFDIDNVGRYLYYPMHLQPEMTTSALGGRIYNDQFLVLGIVLEVASRLGLSLVIKEHPMQCFSHRNLKAYSQILSRPDVHLAPRTCNSTTLLKGSSLVCTVSGTVGVESVYYRKPVICLGETWYKDLDHVYSSVEDFFEDSETVEHIRSINVDQSLELDSDGVNLSSQLFQIVSTCWPGSPWDNFRKNAFKEDAGSNVNSLSNSIATALDQIF